MFDSLSELGQSFQSKVIISLISDKEFLESAEDILYPEYFDSDANRWIVSVIKNYYQKYKDIPTADVFKQELINETSEIFKQEILKKLEDAFKFINSTDLKYIKDNFLQFCINQHYKISIYKSVDLLKNKEYDKIRKLFDDAAKLGQNKNIGLKLLQENVEDIFKKMNRKTISTPWEVINDITEGGTAAGELSIIVSGPGGGKTWTLVSIGAHVLKLGLNVVHYTLELSEAMIAKRYYSALTSLSTHELPFNIDEIEEKIIKLSSKGSNLIIKQYPTKFATVNTLRAHIDKLIKLSLKPDIVIIDYGDLLKAPQFYREKRLEIGNIFEEIRGLAAEFQVPVWTATQANRSASTTDIILGEQISEDYSKIMIGDFIFSISRKVEDSKYKTARVFIIKNRFGVDKITFPAKFDVSNGNLSIYQENSIIGKELKDSMNNEENIIKQKIKERIFNVNKKIDD